MFQTSGYFGLMTPVFLVNNPCDRGAVRTAAGARPDAGAAKYSIVKRENNTTIANRQSFAGSGGQYSVLLAELIQTGVSPRRV